jgi:WD40 repeat protein
VAFVSADSTARSAETKAVGNTPHCQYRIVAVRADGAVGAHRLAFDASKREYSLECDAFGGLSGSSRRAPASPFAADAAKALSPKSFATLAGGRVLVSCGHWDHGVRAAATEDGRELQIATGHRDLVTCLATAALGAGAVRRPWAKRRFDESLGLDALAGAEAESASALVVSGSRDTTLCVWEVSPPPGGWGLALSRSGSAKQLSFARGGGLGERPKRTLFGHDDAVTCAAVSAELDLVASGGADGAVLLHALRAGRFLRAVRRGGGRGGERTSGGVPSWVALLEGKIGTARVLVYCADALSLSCFGVNASTADAPALASASLAERANALCVTPDERFLALAQEKGSVAVRSTHDLSPWARLEGPGPAVTAIRVAADDVFVGGLRDGRIAVWAPARS